MIKKKTASTRKPNTTRAQILREAALLRNCKDEYRSLAERLAPNLARLTGAAIRYARRRKTWRNDLPFEFEGERYILHATRAGLLIETLDGKRLWHLWE
ncbi:MAG: hypothetical protein ACREV9_17775 [Burkholderiales bacterium]